MAAKDLFIKIVAFLGMVNFILFLLDVSNFLDVSQVIGTFITLGLAAVAVSVIPFINSGSSSVKWFLSSLLVISLLYSVTVNLVILPPLTVGLGLITNITNLFPSSPSNVGFLGFLLFHFLGFIALISGILGMGGGGD